MASKTIKISPISENFTQEDIRNALADTTVVRVLIKRPVAYVQLESEDAIDVLEFTNPDNKIYTLDGANFQKVAQNFRWDSVSSDSSSIQELKEDREHFEKIEENMINLIEPKPQNLITISNCDVTILSGLSEKEIKTKVFAGFNSVDRILKRGNRVIVELEDAAEAQKLEAVFPNLKIAALGHEAHVDLEAEDVTGFVTEWLEQHNKENQAKPSKTEEEEKTVLHEEIFPKLNKLTSMETDFLNSQQSSGAKTENRFQDITQQSSEHVHTKNELPSENQGFIMGEELQPEREEIMIGMGQDQEIEKKRKEEEHRKIEQQLQRVRQQERKRIQEAERHERERIQKQKHEKAQVERIERETREHERKQNQRKEREQQEKEKHEAEVREKQRQAKQKKDREEKERQEAQRKEAQRKEKERQDKTRKEQQERVRHEQQRQRQEQQRVQKERKENEQRQKQRLLKEEQEKVRIAVEKEHIEKERLHEHLRIEREKEEAERKRKEAQQFILQNAEKGKENLENFIMGTGAETIKGLVQTTKSQSQGHLAFWSIVMVTLFALLLI